MRNDKILSDKQCMDVYKTHRNFFMLQRNKGRKGVNWDDNEYKK